ncbi:MAG: response regulator [Nitriliruptorales bacterium]
MGMFRRKGRLSVLVVDDEPGIRQMLDMALSVRGMTVTGASDGASGLAAARAKTPDVIICDVMMPGMDGFEVTRRLRSDPHLRDIPVILLTALAGDMDQWQGWSAGAASYVTKPVDPELLVSEVKRVTS